MKILLLFCGIMPILVAKKVTDVVTDVVDSRHINIKY